ncbi:MAG: class II fructose-bisphosphate aldolase, partial [Patescibacteria group bacterium]
IALAVEKKTALGHFNISNLEGFWAVVNAAKNLEVPVIIGVSEGERDFVGVKQIKALVDSVKADGQPVFLNADHTYSLERIKEVINAKFDSVIIDEADKGFDENLRITKEAVEYAKGKEVLVEAELGFIGKSSKLLDEIPEGVSKTTVEEARKFVEETGINLFAPAVGNVHGMLKSGLEPKLDIELIKQIKEAVKIPLVLHGASGNSDEEIREAINAGISIIHINTELRVAYRKGLMKSLQDSPDEIAPYKYLRPALHEMQAIVEKKLKLFNNL